MMMVEVCEELEKIPEFKNLVCNMSRFKKWLLAEKIIETDGFPVPEEKFNEYFIHYTIQNNLTGNGLVGFIKSKLKFI